jgi:hypothetical protein
MIRTQPFQIPSQPASRDALSSSKSLALGDEGGDMIPSDAMMAIITLLDCYHTLDTSFTEETVDVYG